MNRTFCLIVSLLILFPFRVHAQNNNNDGYWWKDLNSDQKLFFIMGFVDGVTYADGTVRAVFPNAGRSKTGQVEFIKEECDFYNIHNGQLAHGLEEFYQDFRNQSIEATSGLSYVRDQIRGKSPKVLERELTFLRARVRLRSEEVARRVNHGLSLSRPPPARSPPARISPTLAHAHVAQLHTKWCRALRSSALEPRWYTFSRE